MALRTPNGRRKGDKRPWHHRKGLALTLTPESGQPFRWRPTHGQPSCIGEWFTQRLIVSLSFAPFYWSVVAVLTLLTFLLVLWAQ